MTTISLVTGANRGLGRNTALSIARCGGDVVLTFRGNAEQAYAVVSDTEELGRKAVALRLAVADISSFRAFAEDVKGVLGRDLGRETFDHLVNNAGQGKMASFSDTTEAQFDALFDTHVRARTHNAGRGGRGMIHGFPGGRMDQFRLTDEQFAKIAPCRRTRAARSGGRPPGHQRHVAARPRSTRSLTSPAGRSPSC